MHLLDGLCEGYCRMHAQNPGRAYASQARLAADQAQQALLALPDRHCPDLELRTEKLVCLLAETKIIDLSQECQAKEAQRVKNLAVERKNPRVTEQMTHRLLRLTLSKKEFEALFRESRRGSIGEPW